MTCLRDFFHPVRILFHPFSAHKESRLHPIPLQNSQNLLYISLSPYCIKAQGHLLFFRLDTADREFSFTGKVLIHLNQIPSQIYSIQKCQGNHGHQSEQHNSHHMIFPHTLLTLLFCI